MIIIFLVFPLFKIFHQLITGLFFYRRLDIGCGKISASRKVGNGEDVFGQLQLKPVLHTGRLRRKSRHNHKPRNRNTVSISEVSILGEYT